MRRYFSSILTLCWLIGIVSGWSLGTSRAEDRKDQALHREAARAVQKKDWATALTVLDRWLTWRTQRYGAQSKETGEANWYCGEVYAKAGQPGQAIEAFRRAIAIFSIDPGPRSKQVGSLLVAIADAQQAQGQSDEAIASLRKALEIAEDDPGIETPVTATCLNKLSLLRLYRDAARFRQCTAEREGIRLTWAVRRRHYQYPSRGVKLSAPPLTELSLTLIGNPRSGEY